jgi:hypothetical protein
MNGRQLQLAKYELLPISKSLSISEVESRPMIDFCPCKFCQIQRTDDIVPMDDRNAEDDS